MEERDYLLLEYLSRFDRPIKIEEENMPDEIRASFHFLGRDKNMYPDSIYVRLFELSRYKYIIEKYVDMYELTDLGRAELRKYQERNAPKTFAKQCDAVLRLINAANKNGKRLNTVEISEALNIDQHTVEAIAIEFKKLGFIDLSATAGHFNFHVQPEAHLFEKKTSFLLEKEKEMKIGSIHNSFNQTTNTTHGAQSPIISDGSSQSVSYQGASKPADKKGILQTILEYFKNPIVSAVSAFVVTASGSLLIVGPCNPTRNGAATLLKAKTKTNQDTISGPAQKNAHSYP